jgi:DinB superfamily
LQETWNHIIWMQLGASLDMLGNAIEACPPRVWSDPLKKPEWPENGVPSFWYLAYHTLFWTDFNLSGSTKGFYPPAPFDLGEFDEAGLLPASPYSKDQLLRYLDHCQRKGLVVLGAMTAETALRPCEMGRLTAPFVEGLLYAMRHVQHHTAQLNLLLRQQTSSAPRWIGRPRRDLNASCVNWRVAYPPPPVARLDLTALA